ncbi:hypothetical protein IAQ61_003665 [Plenodomus lingam]|uniref:uncharacterized protein n=1 Tax=Leptosphaeria maculans TaxID=5022 RepID=UPI0033252223|nr:hypothetical protein IAQ61_003665 [Plenodomus lingam]
MPVWVLSLFRNGDYAGAKGKFNSQLELLSVRTRTRARSITGASHPSQNSPLLWSPLFSSSFRGKAASSSLDASDRPTGSKSVLELLCRVASRAGRIRRTARGRIDAMQTPMDDT